MLKSINSLRDDVADNTREEDTKTRAHKHRYEDSLETGILEPKIEGWWERCGCKLQREITVICCCSQN